MISRCYLFFKKRSLKTQLRLFASFPTLMMLALLLFVAFPYFFTDIQEFEKADRHHVAEHLKTLVKQGGSLRPEVVAQSISENAYLAVTKDAVRSYQIVFDNNGGGRVFSGNLNGYIGGTEVDETRTEMAESEGFYLTVYFSGSPYASRYIELLLLALVLTIPGLVAVFGVSEFVVREISAGVRRITVTSKPHNRPKFLCPDLDELQSKIDRMQAESFSELDAHVADNKKLQNLIKVCGSALDEVLQLAEIAHAQIRLLKEHNRNRYEQLILADLNGLYDHGMPLLREAKAMLTPDTTEPAHNDETPVKTPKNVVAFGATGTRSFRPK